eukprot:803395-Prymnesium_polylepis.2
MSTACMGKAVSCSCLGLAMRLDAERAKSWTQSCARTQWERSFWFGDSGSPFYPLHVWAMRQAVLNPVRNTCFVTGCNAGDER